MLDERERAQLNIVRDNSNYLVSTLAALESKLYDPTVESYLPSHLSV